VRIDRRFDGAHTGGRRRAACAPVAGRARARAVRREPAFEHTGAARARPGSADRPGARAADAAPCALAHYEPGARHRAGPGTAVASALEHADRAATRLAMAGRCVLAIARIAAVSAGRSAVWL